MKAQFAPAVDSIEEVLNFVTYCYDRGVDIHIETYGTPKRRRRSRERKQAEADQAYIEKEVANADRVGEGNRIAAYTNGPGKDVDPVGTKKTVKRRSRKKPGTKKRAPDITKQRYLAIKAGDADTLQQYTPHTINTIMKTRNWNHFLTYKANQARIARERKAKK